MLSPRPAVAVMVAVAGVMAAAGVTVAAEDMEEDVATERDLLRLWPWLMLLQATAAMDMEVDMAADTEEGITAAMEVMAAVMVRFIKSSSIVQF
jgi:hypothetical protein